MRVVHVMSDGTIRDSIEGLVIPKEHPVYKVLKSIRIRKSQEERQRDTAKGQKTA